jgi:ribosomal protein L24p/L26e, archaeal
MTAEPSEFGNHYYIVKTSAKHERTVADNIKEAIENEMTDVVVSSIVVPDDIKGYVFIESPEEHARIEQLVETIAHAYTVLHDETSMEEIKHFLVPKPAVSGIDEGTIVELIAGPFKGEKAVVKRVDHSKEEITVELYESIVPIPITVRGDNVRVIDKGQE